MESDPVYDLGLILDNMKRYLLDGYEVSEFDVDRAIERYKEVVELIEKKSNA